MPTGVPRQDIGLQKDFKDREEKLGSTKDNIEHENGEECAVLWALVIEENADLSHKSCRELKQCEAKAETQKAQGGVAL